MAVSIKGLLFVLLVVATWLLYSSLYIIPSIILLPLSVKYSGILFQMLFRRPAAGLFAALVELICGTKIVISGDVKEKLSGTRPVLIISNHRSRIDWFFAWSLFLRLGSLAKQKVVTKSFFKDIPVFGWALGMDMHVFVEQNWEKDKETIRDTIRYYRDISLPVHLSLFPEGTALTDSNRRKHLEFSKKKGLEEYEYIMHPRTKGFIQCVNLLKDVIEFDICNVTVGYVGDVSHMGKETLQGDIPSEIHYNVKRVPYSEFASFTDEELEEWLQKLWKEKEGLLKKFYQNKSFDSSPVLQDDWTITGKLFGFLAYALVSYVVFLYYLPWTLAAVTFFSIVSYCVHRFKGGWSQIILNMTKKKQQ